MKLSERASQVGMSPTIAIDEKERQLRAQGVTILGFGAGQPDALTPAEVCEAGIEAIREGHLRYTSPGGTLPLRQVIAEKLRVDNGLSYSPAEILVSAGAKQAIYMALAALIDPGDEVLIPSPYWVSYPAQVSLLGGVPRVLHTDESTGFKLTPEALREALGGRARCLILNTPSNPTGAVYTRAELEALAGVILESDLHVITDEIYEYILYDGAEHVSPVTAVPALRDRTAVINGVSKSYSMTGWRIGYMAAPEPWTQKAVAIQSHISGNPCAVSQEAARAAMTGSRAFCDGMVQRFAGRRRIVLDALARLAEVRVSPPMGAFYAFPDVSAFLEDSRDILGLAEHLIDQARVAVVPGVGFGSGRHLRISFATADEIITQGMQAFVDALSGLRR